MTYRELINLYKNGKLDEEQKAKVEQDIERQEAISEYLFDEGEIPGLEDLVDNSTKDSGDSENTSADSFSENMDNE